jgi:hypothetical protein
MINRSSTDTVIRMILFIGISIGALIYTKNPATGSGRVENIFNEI